jgi:hypothetical protein
MVKGTVDAIQNPFYKALAIGGPSHPADLAFNGAERVWSAHRGRRKGIPSSCSRLVKLLGGRISLPQNYVGNPLIA